MNREFFFAGLVGLGAAIFIHVSAARIVTWIPLFVTSAVFSLALFAALLLVALLEIPVMIIAIRQLVHSPSVLRLVVCSVFAAYVAFAAVYSMLYILVTHEKLAAGVITAVSVLRLASGALAK